jgi:ArsR family transcriptional regulator, arsenate/arsenite/antimonite-responsive transcriptional repressor
MTPSVIAERLGVAPNTLSFHLKELVHANLVTSEPRGRNLIYRANFQTMNSLLGYMTEHCCQAVACDLDPTSTCTTC